MSRLRLRWPSRRSHPALSLKPQAAAFRSSPDEGPAPPLPPDDEMPAPPSERDEPDEAPDAAEEPAEPEAPAVEQDAPTEEAPAVPPPLKPAPSQQKLTLYAAAALVVLIVIVIVALGTRPSRHALGYVPMGQSHVQTADMRRFANGPVYRILTSLNHPIAQRLERVEREWNLSLKRDVALLIDSDDLTILIGRFDVAGLRKEFERAAAETEKALHAQGAASARLKLAESDVIGRTLVAWQNISTGPLSEAQQRAIDRAFAAVGSSVVCFGRRASVERFLRCHAGERDNILADPHFAAAYDRHLAQKMTVRRLERPTGAVLTTCLMDLLGVGTADLRAAFYAIGCSDVAVQVTVRIVAEDEKVAEALEANLAKPEAAQALAARLGERAKVAVSRRGDAVTVTASVDIAAFERVVVDDVGGKAAAGNLILTVLAQ